MHSGKNQDWFLVDWSQGPRRSLAYRLVCWAVCVGYSSRRVWHWELLSVSLLLVLCHVRADSTNRNGYGWSGTRLATQIGIDTVSWACKLVAWIGARIRTGTGKPIMLWAQTNTDRQWANKVQTNPLIVCEPVRTFPMDLPNIYEIGRFNEWSTANIFKSSTNTWRYVAGWPVRFSLSLILRNGA